MEPTHAESQERTDLAQRDVRALTECMTVLPEGGDVFTVVGENENGAYHVDARADRCTCPDARYREGRCKHIRRVAFATGERAIPAWVDHDAVDPFLGEHVDGEPKVTTTDGGTPRESVAGVDDNDDERPADCNCGEWNEGHDLACWPCFREGFEEPNPTAMEGDE